MEELVMRDLLVGLAFTIGTFFILLLLYFVYYFQDRRTGIKADLYRYAIIINAILIISELISSFLLYDKLSPILGEILLKFHWYTGVMYFHAFYFYADAHLKNINDIDKKEFMFKRKEAKIINIITLIFTIVFCIIQFKDLDYHALSYLPGMPAYIVFAYAVIIVMVTFFKYIKKKNKTKNEKKFIILFLCVPTVDLALQIIWLNVAFSPTLMAVLLLGCYFLLENPDLYIAKELEETKKALEYTSIHKEYILSLKTQVTNNKVLSINQNLYNAISNSDRESSKEEVNNNLTNLVDVIHGMQSVFNTLTIDEDNTKTFEYEYNTKTLLNKLYFNSLNKIKNKNIKLSFEIDPFLPISLYGDENIIYQTLSTCLSTAIDNTNVGKITFKLRCNFVNNRVLLRFDVSDTSNGLDENIVNKINSDTINDAEIPMIENYYISKKYLSFINGTYVISSNIGAGNNVTINFEQKIINQSKIGDITFDEVDYNINIANRKILIVDNNSNELKYLLNKYNNINYEVVNNFEECINKIKLDETITTVLLNPTIDLTNENMAKTLKSIMPIHQGISNKVIAILANTVSYTRKKYIEEGYDFFIEKPFNEYDLNELLNKI